MAVAPLPLFEPDEGPGNGVATMPRGGPFAAALEDRLGVFETTLDAGATIGVDAGAREITVSPGGTAATGGGAFDTIAAGDGVDGVDGDVASAPSECGCSPLT